MREGKPIGVELALLEKLPASARPRAYTRTIYKPALTSRPHLAANYNMAIENRERDRAYDQCES